MKRAILCGVLMLAGCGRPESGDRVGESARPGGPSGPTAEQARGVEAGGGGAGRGQPTALDMIPDPVYTPREEDPVNLIADSTPAFSRASLFDEASESPESEDRMRRMIERKEVVELEGKAPVLVLRNLDPADAREPGRHYAVEVRVLAGVREGETWFVDESAVGRLVPRVAHPPLEPGSYARVAGPGTIAYPAWEALDPTAGPPSDAASRGSFRLEEGDTVVVEEARGEAVRVKVHSPSKSAGRVGIVARPDLRPIVPQSSPIPTRPAADR